jgi:hypothetical protein
VLGAGASASSKGVAGESPPNWTTFLEHGLDKIDDADDRDVARNLLERRLQLDAAQIIYDSVGSADFSTFIRDEFESPDYQPSKLHEHILRIDPKVVITTNYDQIFETFARRGSAKEAYNVCKYYDSHFVNDLRSNRRLIVKAHGCVSDPQKIILTKRQYFEARRDHPQFYATLDALFLTSTLLFVGSGFSGDPDIELLLQSTFISAPSDHKHYAIAQDGRHPSIKRAIEETHNIKFLEYPEGEHDEVINALAGLADSVESYRSVGNE